ncbi:hypothetical protein Tco_1380412 [Tanacetum coccineum]
MEFELVFPLINLSRRGNRMCAEPEPFMNSDQILQELGQLQDLSHNIEAALHNAQNVQNGLLPKEPLLHTSQIPPPSFYPSTTFQTLQTSTIPPFRPILPPSQTFVLLDQSLWVEGPSSIPQPHEHTCPYCQRTQTLIHEVQYEMRFMLNHILNRLNHLANQKP